MGTSYRNHVCPSIHIFYLKRYLMEFNEIWYPVTLKDATLIYIWSISY